MLTRFKPCNPVKVKSEFSRNVLTLMTDTTIVISTKARKQYTSLIKSLSMFLYNSPNNAHHSIYRVGGLFYFGE